MKEQIIEMVNNKEDTWSILEKILALSVRKYGNDFSPYKINIQHKSVSIREESYSFGVTYKVTSNNKSLEEAVQECINNLILHWNEEEQKD